MQRLFPILAILSLLSPIAAWAGPADAPVGIPDSSQTPLAEGPGGGIAILARITNWIFTILLALAVLFLILAAFYYLGSQGSEERVNKAHKMLMYTAVAVAVAILARGIVFLVNTVVAPGVDVTL